MWQLCLKGQVWSGGACNGTPVGYSWDQATALTETFANYSDWHLPSLTELESLVDYTRDGPAINASIFLFPGITPSYFWSATAAGTHSLFPNCPWFVDFKYGNAYGGNNKLDNTARLFVRLVRGGRVFDTSTLSVSKSGTGTVSSALAGIDCGTSCTGSYIQGTKIVLSVTPVANLIAWGGACSGSTLTCTVTMDAPKSASASFLSVPAISGLPPELSFALQNVGSTSVAQTITLSNVGTAALMISSIAASGDYSVTHNCGTGLGVGGYCVLSIAFSPTASGPRTGNLTVISNSLDSPYGIALNGTGQGSTSTISPSALSFAAQGIGTSSVGKAITIINTGALAITIKSIVANGDFGRTTTCSAALPKGSNCVISVTFTPKAAGTRTGSLVINSDAEGSPNTILLTGTGVASPLVSLTPTSLYFATQGVGTSSTAQTIGLTNSGSAALSLSNIQASGDFAQTNNCGGGLGAGGECNISVSFIPTALGTRGGVLSITSNAPGSPHSVALVGGNQLAAGTDCLFNWAEKTYPQYFTPAGKASATATPYYYRYYSGKGNYLATSSADNHIWVLGPSFGTAPVDVGPIADYLGMAGCSQ